MIQKWDVKTSGNIVDNFLTQVFPVDFYDLVVESYILDKWNSRALSLDMEKQKKRRKSIYLWENETFYVYTHRLVNYECRLLIIHIEYV